MLRITSEIQVETHLVYAKNLKKNTAYPNVDNSDTMSNSAYLTKKETESSVSDITSVREHDLSSASDVGTGDINEELNSDTAKPNKESSFSDIFSIDKEA